METKNDQIDLRRYLKAIRQKKYYYIGTFIILMTFAIMYIYITPKQYRFHSTILIENEDDTNSKAMGGGMVQMLRTFSVGGFGSTSVDNEIIIMQSHELIKETVTKLKLNRTYVSKKGLKKEILYKNSPITIAASDLIFDTLQTTLKFKIEINKKGEGKISVTKGFFSKKISQEHFTKLPVKISTQYGSFDILPTTAFQLGEEYNIQVNISNNDAVTEYLEREITVDYASKKADGISFELKDVNKERGCDILNTLMLLYNRKRVERKNEKAKYEVEFTNERIISLEKELVDAEELVEHFKIANNLSDIKTEMKALITQESEVRQTIVTQQSQIMILDMISTFLNNPQNKYSLLPMSEGLNDKAATEVLVKYNELLLEKMKLERSAKNSNIAMRDLKAQIDAMRNIVVTNIQRLKDNVIINLNNVSNENSKFTARLNTFPKLEREYYNLMRDKELKNDLYIFLLEKRENSSMKLASSLPPGFIIDKAYAESKPLSTKKYIVLFITFLLALIIPTIYIIFALVRKNVINYIFDFPKPINENSIFVLTNENSKYIQGIRKIRAHLFTNDRKILLVTSTIPNKSKTIITIDILKSIASIEKKVIIIELNNSSDLDRTLEIEFDNRINYMKPNINSSCTDDILINDRFIQIIDKLKKEYDYIFINLPPITEIADIPTLTERFGDLIYIIQEGEIRRDELIKNIHSFDKTIFVLNKKINGQ